MKIVIFVLIEIKILILDFFLKFVSECDQTFVSRTGEPLNGTFHAPEFVNAKGHSRQCIFTFIAGPGQRVEVVFTKFALRGTPPESVFTFNIQMRMFKSQII